MDNEQSLKNIIGALVAFQGALVPPKKETDNPFFKSKYADLAGVWESCRPLMMANGLALVQSPSTAGNVVTVTGTLYHTSGESITSILSGTAKDTTPQAIGSAITYFRRYQMCAVLGVAAEDDDGAAASGTDTNWPKAKTQAQIKGPFSHGIPKAQFDAEQAEKRQDSAQESNTKPSVPFGQVEKQNPVQAAVEAKKPPNPWTGKIIAISPKVKGPAGTAWERWDVETKDFNFSVFEIILAENAVKAISTGEDATVIWKTRSDKSGKIWNTAEAIDVLGDV